MQLPDLTLHPGIPATMWIVVEQPPHEERRLKYDPDLGAFVPTGQRSLSFVRAFPGAYGRIGGLGAAPQRHADVPLVTASHLCAGFVAAGRVTGLFVRGDGDNKLVALDEGPATSPAQLDLLTLDRTLWAQITRVYPEVGPGEGWHGARSARAYLMSLARGWGAGPS